MIAVELRDRAVAAHAARVVEERINEQAKRAAEERRIWTKASHYTRRVLGLKDGEQLIMEPLWHQGARVRFGISGLGQLMFEYRQSHYDTGGPNPSPRREYLGVLVEPTFAERAAHWRRELAKLNLQGHRLSLKPEPMVHEVKDLADVGRWL